MQEIGREVYTEEVQSFEFTIGDPGSVQLACGLRDAILNRDDLIQYPAVVRLAEEILEYLRHPVSAALEKQIETMPALSERQVMPFLDMLTSRKALRNATIVVGAMAATLHGVHPAAAEPVRDTTTQQVSAQQEAALQAQIAALKNQFVEDDNSSVNAAIYKKIDKIQAQIDGLSRQSDRDNDPEPEQVANTPNPQGTPAITQPYTPPVGTPSTAPVIDTAPATVGQPEVGVMSEIDALLGMQEPIDQTPQTNSEPTQNTPAITPSKDVPVQGAPVPDAGLFLQGKTATPEIVPREAASINNTVIEPNVPNPTPEQTAVITSPEAAAKAISDAAKDIADAIKSGDNGKVTKAFNGERFQDLDGLGRLLAGAEAWKEFGIESDSDGPKKPSKETSERTKANKGCAPGTEYLDTLTQMMRGTGANVSVAKRTIALCAINSIRSIYPDVFKGANGRAVVRAEASKNFSDLGKAYLKENGKKLTVGDSTRTNALQNKRNGGGTAHPNAAAPTGKSRHESGQGADFQLGGISKGAEVSRTCKNPQTRNTPVHKWLRENAPKYGLGQHPGEAWHWDTADGRCTYGYKANNKVTQEKTKSTSKYEPLLELIAKRESDGNYNAFHANADNKKVKLTDMTIAEVLRWQDEKQYLKHGGKSSAAGKYQILEETLRELVKDMKIDTDKKFNAAMQDRLAVGLLERRGLKAYLDGSISIAKFLSNVAHEWAAMPVNSSGAGAYDHDGLNKAHISWRSALRAAKAIR